MCVTGLEWIFRNTNPLHDYVLNVRLSIVKIWPCSDRLFHKMHLYYRLVKLFDTHLSYDSYQVILHVNACVAHGGWVPRNLGAGAADPNPGSNSTLKSCPTRNQPRAPPAIPSPSPSTRHTEPELHGNNDNSNNQ